MCGRRTRGTGLATAGYKTQPLERHHEVSQFVSGRLASARNTQHHGEIVTTEDFGLDLATFSVQLASGGNTSNGK